MIERIKVAGSSVSITRVGFGCARIYGGSELKGSVRLIEAALAAGIRHFDTAPPYGGGFSEMALGEALAGVPDVTVATKVGIERREDDVTPRPARRIYRRVIKPLLTRAPSMKTKMLELIAGGEQNVSPPTARRRLEGAHLRRELEASLKRLKRDRVDLYLIHEPDQFELDDESLECCHDLKRSGAISAFGLAFGRAAGVVPNFGTIVQSRFGPGCDSDVGGERTRIYHGLFRHGWSKSGKSNFGDVGEYLRNFLESHPEVGVVFSASSIHQIRQVTAQLQDRPGR